MRVAGLACAVLLGAVAPSAGGTPFGVRAAIQDTYDTGELQGFTKGSGDRDLVRLDQPMAVRSVIVRVRRGDADDALSGVLFEIRGPGQAMTIRSAETGKDGIAAIAGVPDGEYAFKATLDGMRTIVGRVFVSSRARAGDRVDLRMTLTGRASEPRLRTRQRILSLK